MPDSGESSADVTRPQQINDARLSWNGDLVLDWSAPFDDSLSEAVSSYEIRYSYAFFDSTGFWDRAVPIPNPPSPPGLPNAAQQYVFSEVERTRIHVAVRSRDEEGNLSELSNIASFSPPGYTFVGSCFDVFESTVQVAGLHVEATIDDPPFPVRQLPPMVTDVNGAFAIEDIPPGATLTLSISDGQTGRDFHEIEVPYVMHEDLVESFPMIEVDDDLIVTSYGTVFNLLLDRYIKSPANPSTPVILRRWESFPIEIHVPPDSVYNLPTFHDDALVAGVALWNTLWQAEFGYPMFNLVFNAPPPAIGIYVTSWYNPNQTQRAFAGPREQNGDGNWTLWELSFNVAKFSPTADLDAAHELGHTMPWGHSTSSSHLMWLDSGPFSTDDMKVAILMYRLPDGTNLSMYDPVPNP